MRATRDAVGPALLELGDDPRVVVLDADLGHSTRAAAFGERWPERYFQMGIAEANMVGVAAGMAASGLLPYVSSFAVFLAGRAWEQARLSVAYSRLPVRFLASHAGLATGPDGASHQMAEDIATMSAIPGMVVLAPSDYNSAIAAIKAAHRHPGPVYIRLTRPKAPDIYPDGFAYQVGQVPVHGEGKVAICSHGLTTHLALEAQARLAERGISVRVYDFITIKPLPLAVEDLRSMELVVVVEDHVSFGGLGSILARALAGGPKMAFLDLGDRFGMSGEWRELYEAYGLTPEALVELVVDGLGS